MSVLAAILIALAVGLCVTRASVGLAFLYGCGITSLVMLAVPWSRPWLLVLVLTLFLRTKLTLPKLRHTRASIAVDVCTFILLALYARVATIAPVWSWDFWALFGLKARAFFEHGGVHWAFLRDPHYAFAHPYYPLLVPLQFDFAAVLGGAWSDRWLGAFFPAYVAAFALLVRRAVADEVQPATASAIAFALAALTMSPYIGTAEVPLIVFATSALLLLRRGAWLHAALLLGLAANTKDEGQTFVAAVILALVIVGRWRDALRLWPAVALALPWLVVSRTLVVENKMAAASLLTRAIDGNFGDLTMLFAHATPKLAWLLVLVALPFALKRERVIVIAVAIQFAIFAIAYLGSPYGTEWHIANSWHRLARQLIVPLASSAMMALAYHFEVRNAEARPEHP